MFQTSYQEILNQVDAIDPIAYCRSRNFVDGSVTRLSPYISRGVISTRLVLEKVLARGFDPQKIEKFIQELTWRDYWQQIWMANGNQINHDLKNTQTGIDHTEIPIAINNASTGIEAVDQAIHELFDTGYMHNHMRMYVASIACNQGKSHWKLPAQWMYYHLLDGDWASNALSWQWVVGANSNKKYIANQDNINKYFYSNQKDTFLDVSYEELANLSCPNALEETEQLNLKSNLPSGSQEKIDNDLPIAVYNYYNLDPLWKKEEKVNRVLLLEPSVFEQYPVSNRNIEFILNLAENIQEIQLFVGEFDELTNKYPDQKIYFKEHPLNNYNGIEDSRDWMFNVNGSFSSFFGFWKKCKKELKR